MIAILHRLQGPGFAMVVCFFVALACSFPQVWAREPVTSEEVKKAHAGLNQSLKAPPSLEERVRAATWKLLLGEFASSPEKAMLFSGAVDSLEEGSREIEEILKELGKDRKKWEPLAKNPAVLARLDTALVRKEETEKKKDLARAAERKRLETLRQMVKAYRDANSAMASANTAFQTGDFTSVREKSIQVRNSIQKIRQLASEKQDWYLLSDEPNLDGKSELKLVDLDSKDILPLGEELLDHLNALSAMAAYRLALANPTMPQADLLDEAEKAIADIKAASPGSLARYVQGQVARVRGLMKTTPDPLSESGHAQARPYFQQALVALKEAAKAPQSPSSKILFGKDFEETLKALEGPAWFLTRADKEVSTGRFPSAMAILLEGQTYHRTPEIANQLVLLKLKTGDNPLKTREYLEAAIKAGLVPQSSAETQLVRGRLQLASASDLLFQPGGPGKESEKTLQALLDAQASFKQVKPEAENSNAPKAEAYLALAQAYKIAIVPNIPKEESQAIYQSVILATEALKTLARNPSAPVEINEALAAGYLARGMLAPVVLPDFRNEAQASLAAAAEVQARLPGSIPGVHLSGNALASGILQRPDSQIQRLAIQERLLREALGQLTQASTSLALGNSTSALQQAESAYEGAEFARLVENGKAAVPAETVLNSTPTLDAAKEVTEQARAFAILTGVVAGKPKSALAFALKNQPQSLESAEEILTKEENPLVVFALGRAMEGYAAIQIEEKAKWTALALKAQDKAGAIMARSSGYRSRFPEVENLVTESRQRLTRPVYFLEQARKYRQANNLQVSAKWLNDGLALHPQVQALRELLLELELDRAELGETQKQDWEKTILDAGEPKSARAALLLGNFSEKAGNRSKALEYYEKANRLHPEGTERVELESRIALLRVLALKR